MSILNLMHVANVNKHVVCGVGALANMCVNNVTVSVTYVGNETYETENGWTTCVFYKY